MKKILCSLLALCFTLCAISSCSPGGDKPDTPDNPLPDTTTAPAVSEQTTTSSSFTAPIEIVQNAEFASGRSTLLTLEDTGVLQVARKERTTIQKTDDGIWTVFAYLCGSNLEGDDGFASYDIEEMLDATSLAANLRFVIETGGSYVWHNSKIDASKKQRFLIEDGKMTKVHSSEPTNMGAASTVTDFLSWGVENYTSEYMGLIFWNHGGGSISGVCFDDKNDFDSLTLLELEAALNSVFDKMTRKFDFIGFDACLMATVETANLLVPHADYMIASQEVEDAIGWDYTAFGSALAGTSTVDALTLGKTICNKFYTSCQSYGVQKESTLSLIDLSKINNLLAEFNEYASALYEAAQDDQKMAQCVRLINDVQKYGYNDAANGYSNMVDLGGIINSTYSVIGDDGSALEALESCVAYSVKGSDRKSSSGLSTYFPVCVQGSNELSVFKGIAISPYYASFCDLVAYSGSSHGSTDDFDGSEWFGDNSFFWNDDYSYDYTEDSSSYGDDFSGWIDYWGSETEEDDDFNFDIGSSTLTYSQEPHLTNDGYYTFTLTNQSMYYLDRVYCNILMSITDEGREYMLDMGTDDYLNIDWAQGTVTDAFDGTWFALPDSQPIACFLIEPGESCNIYSAPVFVNDKLKNLKIAQYFDGEYYECEIIGVTSDVQDDGSSAREVSSLEIGDIITPCYYAYDALTGEYDGYYYGDDYTYTGDNGIYYESLYDADYYYGYEIYDIFENVIYTDFILFGVEGEEIYFYEETWGWSGDYEYDYGDDSWSDDWDDDYWDSDYWNDWLSEYDDLFGNDDYDYGYGSDSNDSGWDNFFW